MSLNWYDIAGEHSDVLYRIPPAETMQHQKTLFSTKFISNTLWQVAHFLGKFWSTMRSDVEFKGLKQGFAEWLKAWNSKVNTLEWWELCGLWKDMQLQLIYDLGHHGHESGYHWLPQRPKSTFFCLYQYLFFFIFWKILVQSWKNNTKTNLLHFFFSFEQYSAPSLLQETLFFLILHISKKF